MNPHEYQAMFDVEDHHWWYRAVRLDIEAALQRLASPGWLLDAGSGTGGLLANLSEIWNRRSVGVEISAEGLRLARVRGLPRLARGSVARLPFADGAFGAIVCIDVLAHRDVDAAAALSEFRRCLATGGILVLQVPAFDWLRGTHDDAVWTGRRYRRKEVEKALREAGLVLRRSFYRNTLLFPLVAVRRLLLRRPGSGSARSDVGPVSAFWNATFGAALRLESSLRSAGLCLPFGLSVFCVAERRR